MTHQRFFSLAASICLLFAGLAAIANETPKLLFFQQPDYPVTYPEYLTDHIAHLDALPGDGITVTAFATFNLMKRDQVFTAQEIAASLAPIANRFQRLDYNFLLIWIDDPGDVFDDAAWAQVVANWRAAAIAARQAGFAGLMFDTEQYGDPWLNFPEDYDAPRAGLRAYSEKTQQRGREIMQAISAVWPEAHVLFTFGPWISEPKTPDYVRLLQIGGAGSYELAGPLFVGFLEGAGPDNRIIDGGEVYQYRSPRDFALAYLWREFQLASEATDSWFIPESLRAGWPQRVSNAFGVYNYPWLLDQGYPMNPRIMESTLRNALNRADDVVWFYTEEFFEGVGNWYVPGSMPQAWTDAVVRAQEN